MKFKNPCKICLVQPICRVRCVPKRAYFDALYSFKNTTITLMSLAVGANLAAWILGFSQEKVFLIPYLILIFTSIAFQIWFSILLKREKNEIDEKFNDISIRMKIERKKIKPKIRKLKDAK